MPDSLRRPIVLGFSSQLAAALLQLVVVLVVARLLGPGGQGKLATAMLPPQLLVVALNLGLGPALIYFLNQGEIGLDGAIATCRRLFALVVPAGLALALLVQLLAGPRLYPGIPTPLLVAALPLLPTLLGRLWWFQLLQARRNFRVYNRLQLLQPILLLTLLAMPLRRDPVAVVLLMAASHAVTWGLAALTLGRSAAATSPTLAADPGFLGRCLRYGLPSLGSNLVEFLNLRGSLFLVNGFLGPHDAGLFKLDTQLGEPLLLPASAAVTVLLPRLSEAELEGSRRMAFTRLWLGRVIGTALVLGLLILLMAPRLVALLFGAAYGGALPVLPLLLPAYVCWSAVNLLWAHMAASGRPRRPLGIGLVTLALNLGTNLVLIPRLGLPGAALASTLTFAGAALLSWAAIPGAARTAGPRTAP